MDEWTELSRSTIYKTLARLETLGLAMSEASLTERNVGRKTYRLSESGAEALRERLREFLSRPEKTIWRVDLATSHLDLLSPGEVGAALSSYEAELEASAKGYGELEAYLRESGCPVHAMALAKRPVALFRAELEWIRTYRAELEAAGLSAPAQAGRAKGGDDGQA